MTTTALPSGQTAVTIEWFNETFSTVVTGTGVQMPVPTVQKVCKNWVRSGYSCRNVVSGGANYYTRTTANPTGGYPGAAQCVPSTVYVVGAGYQPQLPVQCVGSLSNAGSFLVSFSVLGSGTISLSDGTSVSIP